MIIRAITDRSEKAGDLRIRLQAERDQYELCSYIDHYPDCVRCREERQRNIDRLKKQIAAAEAEHQEQPQ